MPSCSCVSVADYQRPKRRLKILTFGDVFQINITPIAIRPPTKIDPRVRRGENSRGKWQLPTFLGLTSCSRFQLDAFISKTVRGEKVKGGQRSEAAKSCYPDQIWEFDQAKWCQRPLINRRFKWKEWPGLKKWHKSGNEFKPRRDALCAWESRSLGCLSLASALTSSLVPDFNGDKRHFASKSLNMHVRKLSAQRNGSDRGERGTLSEPAKTVSCGDPRFERL